MSFIRIDLEEKKKEEEAKKGEKKVFKTNEGKLKCINQGCRKDY